MPRKKQATRGRPRGRGQARSGRPRGRGQGRNRCVRRRRPQVQGRTNASNRSPPVKVHVPLLEIHCPELDCTQVCTTQADFKAHLKDKHGLAPYPCLFKNCTEVFEKFYKLGRHARDHSRRSKSPAFRCPHMVKLPNRLAAKQCKRREWSQQALSKHIKAQHQLRVYGCSRPGCTWQFENYHAARSHITTGKKHTLASSSTSSPSPPPPPHSPHSSSSGEAEPEMAGYASDQASGSPTSPLP